MRKTAFLFLLLLVFSLSLIAGCKETGNKALSYNFKQGTPELGVKLFENAPPKQVYPDSEFKFIVILDNQAAYDATDGTVRVVGLEPGYFWLRPLEEGFAEIKGRSLTNPTGEKIYLDTFTASAGKLLPGAEYYDNNYFLVAYYNSKVEFMDTVCVNSNQYDVFDSGCKVQSRKSYGGQGAPLAVTQIEEIVTPGTGSSVEFRLLLQNRGRGKAGDVNLITARLGNEQLFCKFEESGSNQNSVRLTQETQEAVLICKKPLREVASYETSLFLEFSYDYELREQFKLQLTSGKRSGGRFS